jgi:hypothetical protein
MAQHYTTRGEKKMINLTLVKPNSTEIMNLVGDSKIYIQKRKYYRMYSITAAAAL